ncbi:transcriptional repressor MprA [Symbiopectobacterium sp. RP]|uniref:transcriptional repressor MprA n=1 Tax=Symbiopectobacterium sp. RP TaxID=3248553 RepID=UPI003D2C92D1
MDSSSVHKHGLTESGARDKKPEFDKNSSFSPIEQMINLRASRNPEFPQQEILLVRLCMHMQNKILEHRNKILREQGINETLFMALITLESQESRSIQPSELSAALGSSRTNATRIADELEKRGWIERRENDSDRRCLHLHMTDEGKAFLDRLLPPQHQSLHFIWSALEKDEQKQLEVLMRKLLVRLDEMDKIDNP